MNLRIARTGREEGSVIIIIMSMILVFMALGMALFYLVRSSSLGTELERKELRSFNVAEAGLDAGMLALKTSWPEKPGMSAAVDETALRAQFPANQFRDSVGTGATQPFIDVWIYDNSTVLASDPSYVAQPTSFTRLEDGTIHPNWDKSTDDLRLTAEIPDGRMIVDSRSSVDNDRHRILVQAQRALWPLSLPFIALQADTATANAHGFSVGIDSGQEDYLPTTAIFDPNTSTVDISLTDQPNISTDDVANFPFSQYAGTIAALRSIAQSRGTFFTDANLAATFLFDITKSPGAIVFVDLTALGSGTVTMAGNTPVGTPDNPTVLVLQGQSGLLIDWRGTQDFYGVVIVDGSAMNRGSASFHGSILSSGTLTGKGNGSTDVLYNGDIIAHLNGGYTINVSIVPNTWIENQPEPLTGTTLAP